MPVEFLSPEQQHPTFKGSKRTWGIFLQRVLYPSPQTRLGIPIGGRFWQKVFVMGGH